jgi:hypothetical protein
MEIEMEQQQLRFEDLLKLLFDSVENKLKSQMGFSDFFIPF